MLFSLKGHLNGHSNSSIPTCTHLYLVLLYGFVIQLFNNFYENKSPKVTHSSDFTAHFILTKDTLTFNKF